MALPGSAQAEQATAQAARLTGRGAVLGMALLFTVGLLAAAWLGVTVLAGAFFVLGCGLAAWYTRPADLLTVVLVPPILFSGALILVEAMTASGSLVLSVAAGSVVVLVSVALWLAAGLVLTMAIAWRRGLPQCVRDLRRDLRRPARAPTPGSARTGRPAPANAGRAVAATRAAARTASAPEPPRRPLHR
jgi:hypothetical protein